jgi:hypothetical protein
VLKRISNRPDDTQSVNTIKSNEDGLFVKRLRSLFPAIEIKIEHVCILFFYLFLHSHFILQGSNISWT